jgi:hypothetical protein
MTDTDTPSCGFKIGKYLLEGTAYKNALIRLIDDQVEEGGVLNLTIIFFDGYYTERKGLTVMDFINEISDVCGKADTLSDEIKNKCISDFVQWRDEVLPLEKAEAESNGLTVMEPEMYVFDPPDHDEQDEITFFEPTL